jgi:hypothetical protein
MLDTLITSKTRKKLLLKFFLNSSAKAYLRNLEQELDESPNALRIELNRFEEAKLLKSYSLGNKKYYQANQEHPFFGEIRSILLKYVGLDKIIDNVVDKMGDLEKVFVTGTFARGINSNIIDIVFVGNNINTDYLIKLINKVESLISKKVRYLTIMPNELSDYIKPEKQPALLLWGKAAIEK